MADIYSDLLRGTMEVFGSVISNNMNVIMKRLTILSIALMFPTFIVSFYGMNVKLPFEKNSSCMGFIIISLCNFCFNWLLVFYQIREVIKLLEKANEV